MVSSTNCQGTNKDGSPCSAPAIIGRGWCYWHDPERAESRHAASVAGGENRSREARARKVLAKGMDRLGDVRDVLLLALLDVQAGKLDPKVANAMANLAGKIKDIELGVEVEERIAALQRQTAELSERVG